MKNTRSNQYHQGMTKFRPQSSWVGVLALLGTLLLFIGVSLSSAATPDNWQEKVLPNIFKQLKQQNKVVKSQEIIQAGEQSKVIVTCANGEVREYNKQGKITQVKDSKGKVTKYTDGLPMEERDASGALISKTEYNREGGKVVSSVKRTPYEIEMKIFDREGNIAQVNNSQGIKLYSNYQKDNENKSKGYSEIDMLTNKMSRVELNDNGDIVAKVDENGNRTTFEYTRDALGEISQVTERDNQGNVTIKKMKDGQLQETIKNGNSTKVENKVNSQGKVQETVETSTLKTDRGTLLEKVFKQFDQNGRLLFMRDKDGEHQYSYVLGEGGRMVSKRERVTPPKGSREKPKETTTYYDLAGRVKGTEENGKRTDINYTLDANGNIMAAQEESNEKVNGRAVKQKTNKKYDGKGHVKEQTDTLGRTSKFEYDGKGNRTRTESEEMTTQYFYDKNNNMKMTITTDYKSTTYSFYNTETKLCESKVKVYNSGFVELTQYGNNADGVRASFTLEALGVKNTIYHDKQGEQPQRVISTKFNGKQTITDYVYSGDSMISSKETGPLGTTETRYNVFGKPEGSHRVDQFGREYETGFEYDAKGKTIKSTQTDKKGTTQTFMNVNEEADYIVRTNTIGFPRYSMDKRKYTRGILTGGETTDVKGTTFSKFNPITGLTEETHRVSKHGFPRENWVTNKYDIGGDLLSSMQRDNRGVTKNDFDGDGQMTHSLRIDRHGFPREKESEYFYEKGEMIKSTTKTDRDSSLSNYDVDGLVHDTTRTREFGYPRKEYTTFKYNNIGSMTSSDEQDINGTSHSEYNEDELTAVSMRNNYYGHARLQTTTFSYDNDGYMTFSKEKDLRGITVTRYDIDSLATTSIRYDQYGILYSRDSLTNNEYDDNGFLNKSKTRNIYGDSERQVDKDGLTRKSLQNDHFGLMGGRLKMTDDFKYDDKGRMQTNMEKDALGATASKFDIHGDAIESTRYGNYGLLASRESLTKSTFHPDTGMTTSRVSTNNYGKNESFDFDSVFGIESRQISTNNYGVKGARVTTSQLTLDTRHGLTRHSVVKNILGVTETMYDTEKSEGTYGLSVFSLAHNNYGIGASRVTSTDIEASEYHGLNKKTTSKNAYGLTVTYFDTVEKAAWSDSTYGMAVRSVSQNKFGLGYSRDTVTTTMDADPVTGLNKLTFAKNKYGNTTTYYDTQEKAKWSDGTYGMVVRSVANNNYGIGKARETESKTTDADVTTGLNKETFAHNGYGTTTTYFDTVEKAPWSDGTYGMAVRSVAVNNYGIENARNTTTKTVDADTHTGLNKQTFADNAYGTTTSYFDNVEKPLWSDGTYGMAARSISNNNYGIGDARNTETRTEDANVDNGLNKKTMAKNKYGQTTTYFDAGESVSWSDGTYGMGVRTIAINNFGIGHARTTETNTVDADTQTGLNKQTFGKNKYGTTVTYFDTVEKAAWSDGTHGMAVRTLAANNFGIGNARNTETLTLDADVKSGLNKNTKATNAYGTTVTYFDTVEKAPWTDGSYGMAVRTVSANNYGIGDARNTETKTVDADNQTGLNKQTFAKNTYGTTTSYFDTLELPSWSDGTYGMAVRTVAVNNFGIGNARNTETKTAAADTQTGLNKQTFAKNAYGTTTTYFDTQESISWSDGTYGMAVRTVAVNNYGIGKARNTETKTTEADTKTGLNKQTFAKNAYGTTATYFDTQEKPSWSDGTYGMAVRTVAVNNYGLGHARNTETKTQEADTQTGLNKLTYAKNLYGSTFTYFDTTEKTTWSDGTYGMAARTYALNNYGIGKARNTETKTEDADTQTGLNKRTFANNGYGSTTTYFDNVESATWSDGTYGLAVRTVANNNFGIGNARNTETKTEDADTQTGLNKRTFAKNLYGTTLSYFDAAETVSWSDGTYGLAVRTLANNNYGIGKARSTETKTTSADVQTGLNKQTFAKNGYGQTTTYFDTQETAAWSDGTYGMAVRTVSVNNYGIGKARQTETKTEDADTQTGLNKRTFAKNGYGQTATYFDNVEGASWSNGTYGMAVKTASVNNYGIGKARNTTSITEDADVKTGLNKRTVATNGYGKTTSYFDNVESAPWSDGTYGMAVRTVSENNYGIGMARSTTSKTLDADTQTGLNKKTEAKNGYGTTTSYFDNIESAPWSDGTYGMAVRSVAVNNYGIGKARTTETKTEDADNQTGLNKRTVAVNGYGKTTTYFDTAETAAWSDGTYGMAVRSVSVNNYGIGKARTTETKTESADTQTGMNKRTVATNGYGKTTTYFDTLESASWSDGTYGMAVRSVAENNYGIGKARVTTTKTLEADTQTGLNKKTEGSNGYGTTTSYFDTYEHVSWSDGTYGMAVRTIAENNYGIGKSRHTETKTEDADTQTGLNKRTVGVNAYGKTTSYFDTAESVPWSDGTYGMTVRTVSENNYGIGKARKTTTKTDEADTQTGLNKQTTSANDYSTTTTYFDTKEAISWSDGTYGMSVRSVSTNKYGIGKTRSTTTKTLDADVQTGLNKKTEAQNAYGTTTTYFDTVESASWSNGTYGIGVRSVAVNNYGLGGTRKTTTKTLDADVQTGLNKKTEGTNDYGKTTSYFDTVEGASWTNGTYGMVVRSVSANNYGIGKSRNTTTKTISADTATGLNRQTEATNTYGTTTSYFDTMQSASWSDGTYGMVAKSFTTSNYGVLYARATTSTTLEADTNTGMNKKTEAVSNFGKTTTYFDTTESATWSDGTYGMAVRSVAENKYGIGKARNTTTKTLSADTKTGLNKKTEATNAYGKTTTYFDTLESASWSDGTYGMAVRMYSESNYGIKNGRTTTTKTLSADVQTGLNKKTEASNAYGTTTTYFDTLEGADWSDGTTGMAVRSVAVNKFGVEYARNTTTRTKDADTRTGLNRRTESSNTYSDTVTYYDTMESATWSNGTYGMAVTTVSTNKYGLGYTRDNVSVTEDADTQTGLNKRTKAVNKFGTTWTYYDTVESTTWSNGTYGMAAKTVSQNVYGIGAAKNSTSKTLDADVNTGMNKKNQSTNAYGTTTTYFGTDSHGLQNATLAANNYGTPNERHVYTTFVMDVNTGMNKTSHAESGRAGTGGNYVSDVSRYVDTEFDANTGGTYGYAKKVTSRSVRGPNWGKTNVTNNDTVNTDTGMTVHSTADSMSNDLAHKLSHTENYLFDPSTGTCLRSRTENTYGTKATKKVENVYTPNDYTGLNKSSYSLTGEPGHYYSQTWTDYKDTTTGFQKDSLVQLNSGICYGYAEYTRNDYTVNDYGITTKTIAENLNGITYNYNNAQGLSTGSDYYGNYGAAWWTHTDSTADVNTGIVASSTADTYSRAGGHQKISSTVTTFNADGLATKVVTTNTTGASLAKVNTTYQIDYDEWGFKTKSYSSSGMGSSWSTFDLKGTSQHTHSDSNYGPHNSASSETYSTEINGNNGLPMRSFNENGMNWSNTEMDSMGRTNYVQKHNKFYASVGLNTGMIDSESWTNEFSYTGNPKETYEANSISDVWTYMDDNAFATSTHTKNLYGLAGDENYWTTLWADSSTGMTSESYSGKYTGDYSYSYYSAGDYRDHGVVSSSYNYSAGDNGNPSSVMHTYNTSFNHDTGMVTGSYSTRDNQGGTANYRSYNSNFNSVGQARNTRTTWSQKEGKDWKGKSQDTYHEYWSDNGLPAKDVITGEDAKTKWYDHDGYEAGESAHNAVAPAGYQDSSTKFDKGDQGGDPVSSTTTFGSASSPIQTEVNTGFAVVVGQHNERIYNPRHKEVTYAQGVYIKHARIDFHMIDSLGVPDGATVTDDKGTEIWVMGGSYKNSGMISRDRTNTGGGKIRWEYTDSPSGDYHQAANITYTNYMGIHNGTGTETYTSAGILNHQVLNSTDVYTETLDYTNDGTFINGAVGTREDGMAVSYTFTGMGDIESSSDDKGITTWEPSTHLRTQTTGGFGTFNYTYSGDALVSIQGTSAKDGTMTYDKYWNMSAWIDKSGVSHTYTGTATNKKYWTAATETFTDKNGAKWTGEVTYDTYGFYLKEEVLKSTRAKVDTAGAGNLVAMNQANALNFIKTAVIAHHTENETWTYHSQSDTRNQKILGTLKSESLTASNLNNYADVEITVNEDGTATAIFSNMEFTAKKYNKTNRYKPVVTSSNNVSNTTTPPPGATYSFSLADNAFYSGDAGYKILDYHSWNVAIYRTETVPVYDSSTPPVQTGTTTVQVFDHNEAHYSYTKENWGKNSDGFMWTEAGTEEEKFADKMTQTGNTVIASPVGTKADGVQTANSGKTQAQSAASVKAQGVTLGGDLGAQYSMSDGTMGFVKNTIPAATNTFDSNFGSNALKTGGTIPGTPVATTHNGLATGASAGTASDSVKAEKTDDKQALQAKLTDQFKGMNVQDAGDLAAAALAKMSAEEITAALAGSMEGTKKLMGALAEAYKVMFGVAYQQSLLGSILDTISTSTVFESVKAALIGDAGISKDAKIAAQKEQEEAKYAKVVRDENGNVVEALGKKGEIFKFSYDASGKTVSKFAQGAITVEHFDNNNRLLSETSGGTSKTFAYTVNEKGQVTGTQVIERTEGGTTTLKYNQTGKLASKEQNGITQSYNYKDNSTVEVIARNAQGTELVKKVYEGGRLVSKIDANGTSTKYNYMTDASGNVLGVSMAVTDRDGQTSFYKFNASGEMTGKANVGATRFEKTEDNVATETIAFEAAKELFSDHRMVGEKLDQTQLQLQQVQPPRQPGGN
jgi:hypothetical protein